MQAVRLAAAIAALMTVTAAGAPLPAASEGFRGETELLLRISPEERLTYFGLQYSLNQHQKLQYISLPTREERDEWLRRWWALNDPTPASPRNERRIEHELRVQLARSQFGIKKAPGWDKRGETLIRWGWPAVRVKIPADIGFYRMIPPGEMWHYGRLDMTIMFHDFNLRGEYIYASEQYGPSSRQTLDAMKAVGEYLRLQPPENIMPGRDDGLAAIANFNPDPIDYIASADLRAQLQVSSFADFIEREKMEKSRNNFYKYLKESPTIYSFEIGANPLPVYFNITAFGAGYGAVRMEVNVEIPASELHFRQRGGVLGAEVDLGVLVRDFEMNVVARVSDVIRVEQTGGRVYQGAAFIPGQIAFALEPGYYRIGIEARDRASGRSGSYRANKQLVPLHDRLALSDLLLASTIRPAGDAERFLKGALQVVPHPLHAYRIPFPLTFYFEIYGLDTDRDGMAVYSVEYRIVPLTKKRRGLTLHDVPAAISSRFESTGFGPTQSQQLEIATENLWPGSFRLIVTVMDRRTRETVEKIAGFSIIERARS